MIDVGRQRDIRLTMHELADYYSGGQRAETLNCISLEFSASGSVVPPSGRQAEATPPLSGSM